MKRNEFIKMMFDDISTDKNKEILENVVQAMSECIALSEVDDIDEKGKTPQDLYSKMYDFASKNKTSNAYCFTPNLTLKFVGEYLGLDSNNFDEANENAKQPSVNDKNISSGKQVQIISLDEFF